MPGDLTYLIMLTLAGAASWVAWAHGCRRVGRHPRVEACLVGATLRRWLTTTARRDALDALVALDRHLDAVGDWLAACAGPAPGSAPGARTAAVRAAPHAPVAPTP